jgi:hypothetical protein
MSVSEIGDAENISKSYVSRILRLALVAPEIVEAILAGRTNQSMILERLERPMPAIWQEQRTLLSVGGARPTTRRRRLGQAAMSRRMALAACPETTFRLHSELRRQ